MERLGEIFLKMLRDAAQTKEIAAIYYHLFKMQDLEKLNEELQYLYELSEGKDEYFKEHGKTDWFAIWHKSVRQTDYFTGIVKKGRIELMTTDERKEFKFLRHKVYQKGYDKTDPNGKHLFNDEYRRFLELNEKLRAEATEDSVSGHIDSILWNTVHMDDKDVLYKNFKRTFLEIKMEIDAE